jgi:proliferating cell nuclear antigen
VLFKFRLADAKLLKDVFAGIATLIDEATFNLDITGMKLRAMDPSRVAMVDFEWPASLFEEYTCAEPVKLCVSMTGLLKLLKRASKDEAVEMSQDQKGDKLKITIISKKGTSVRAFSLHTLDASEEESPAPKLTYNVNAKLTTDGISQMIDDAQLVSDHIRITADPEKLVMTAQGDLMTAEITVQKGSDVLLNLEAKTPSKATFGLSHLADVIHTAAATADMVTLEYSSDMPMKLDFQQKQGKLLYYLAPRIESD